MKVHSRAKLGGGLGEPGPQGTGTPTDPATSTTRVQLGKTVHYLPILFIDQLSNRVKDLMVSPALSFLAAAIHGAPGNQARPGPPGSER